MEEITTRFEIIRLAINLGDFRTIDLQCEKLRSLSLDEKLNEIIDLLESRNYRQALYEMKHYASSLEDEFFASRSEKRSSSKSIRKTSASDMGLFDMEEPEEEEERVLDLDDILQLSERRETSPSATYQPAPEFSIGMEEEDERKEAGSEESEAEVHESLSGMTLEDHLAERNSASIGHLHTEKEEAEHELKREPEAPVSFSEEEGWTEAAEISAEEISPKNEETYPPESTQGNAEAEGEARHSPISYISQKFRNMIHQFPPVENDGLIPEEVETMQKKISTDGYTEEEIERFLKRYQGYKEAGKKSEAAMVLLLAAATESKFAQFLLARELFRGEVIREDHAEAFTQINTLADQNFAEAICDLGQFYEHGVGIGKDRQMALLLYEEAAEMGVARAKKHYERLKNSRGLLGVFKKVSLPRVSIPLPKKR